MFNLIHLNISIIQRNIKQSIKHIIIPNWTSIFPELQPFPNKYPKNTQNLLNRNKRTFSNTIHIKNLQRREKIRQIRRANFLQYTHNNILILKSSDIHNFLDFTNFLMSLRRSYNLLHLNAWLELRVLFENNW